MIIKIDQTKVDAKNKQARITELKQLLADTDYIAMPDYDKSKPEILAQRQVWRDEIRSLVNE